MSLCRRFAVARGRLRLGRQNSIVELRMEQGRIGFGGVHNVSGLDNAARCVDVVVIADYFHLGPRVEFNLLRARAERGLQ